MSYLDKSKQEIKDEVYKTAQDILQVQQFRPQGVLKGIVETLAHVVAWLYTSILQPLKKQSNLDGATGVFLDSWGNLLGVERKPATNATGKVTITVYRDVTIHEGQRITVDASSLVFYTTNTVAITKHEGSKVVPVVAEATGDAYNIVGTPLSASLNPIVSGVDTVRFLNDWQDGGVTGGSIEGDDQYRDSIKTKWLSTAAGSVPLIYKAEAQSVNGVKKAVVFRTPNGFGSFRIVCVGENNAPFSSDVLQKVREHFDSVGLLARSTVIDGVRLVGVSVRLGYKGVASSMFLQGKIVEYFNGLDIGERYTMQALYDLFDGMSGVDSVEFIAPCKDDVILPVDGVYGYHGTITIVREAG